jgi:hypothetical protein
MSGSTSVGTLSARFGLDPSEFIEKLRGVTGATALFSNQMRREMKESSRDAAESFRTLDEMIGIHLNRPMTRLLVETFPSFAKGLQSILGGVAFGAVGFAVTELYERISKGLENAKKAQQDYDDAVRHTQDAIGDMGAAHTRTMKEISLQLASLSGDPSAKLKLATFKIDTSAMQEAKKNIEGITKDFDEQAKAAEKLNGIWVHLLSTFAIEPYNFWAKILGGAEESGGKLKEVDALVTRIMRQRDGDPMKGLQDSLKEVSVQAKATWAELYALQLANTALETKLQGGSQGVRGAIDEHALTSGKEKADTLAQVVIGLNAQVIGIKDAIDDAMGKGKVEARTAALEAQKKVAAELTSFYKEMGSSLAKLQPETDPVAKIGAEITEFRHKAELDFIALRNASSNALQMKTAHGDLDAYSSELDRLKIKLEAAARAQQALDELGKMHFGEPKKDAPLPVSLAGPTVMPTLGAGGMAGEQFDAFAKDQNAQMELLKNAQEKALGPQEQYALGKQKLDLLQAKENDLLARGAISLEAYAANTRSITAAETQLIDLKSRSAKKGLEGQIDAFNPGGGQMQQLQARMEALRGMQSSHVGLDGSQLDAGDLAAVALEMKAITAEEDQILLKTGGINAGIKAWADGLQRVKSEGEFTYELLTQAVKGFEDNAVKSLENILERQGGGNQKLIKELRTMWAGYFNSLAEMALKHQLDVGIKAGTSKLAEKVPGLKNIFGGGKDAAVTSNTTALGTNTEALIGLSARLSAGGTSGLPGGGGIPGFGGGGTSDGGGGDIGDLTDSGSYGLPGNAGGTDDWSGGPTWVGEQGPEVLNLPRGSQITSNDAATRRGDTHFHNYDMRGAVVTDDLLRKAEGANMMAASKKQAVNEAIAHVSELRRRTPQGR